MKRFSVVNLPEPELEFRYSQTTTYPRDGLYLFGPVDAGRERRHIRYGVIGTPESIRRHEIWASQIATFVDVPRSKRTFGDVEPYHVPFPGFEEVFFSMWASHPSRVISDVDETELRRLIHIGNRYEAVKSVVDVFVERLIADQNRYEDPPHFWYVVIPEFIYTLGRPKSTVARADRVVGSITISRESAAKLSTQPSLFVDDEVQAEIYQYATDFRRQLKARLLDHQIVTQIVRETTLTPNEFLTAGGDRPIRRVEDPATIAWKLCTTSYYKGGGRPWQLAKVRPGVCYVGLIYKRDPREGDSRHACCAAQMFLTDGDGVVFRGALGPWYHPDSRQFHLDRMAACRLVTTVLEEYRRDHREDPKELFIHAKAAFSDEEWEGMVEACSGRVTDVVGVQILDAWDDLKMFRPGNYPVLRGTAMLTSRRSGFLWTSGYVPRLDTYMGPETPNPLRVSIRRGEADIRTVMSDVLALTKMNFNTCLFNDREPVTIRFADAIGDVLVSAPVQTEPRLPFKFYI